MEVLAMSKINDCLNIGLGLGQPQGFMLVENPSIIKQPYDTTLLASIKAGAYLVVGKDSSYTRRNDLSSWRGPSEGGGALWAAASNGPRRHRVSKNIARFRYFDIKTTCRDRRSGNVQVTLQMLYDCLYMHRQWPCGCTLSTTWYSCRVHSGLPSQTTKRSLSNARAIRLTNLTSNPVTNPADFVQVNAGFRAQRVQRVD